MSGYLKLLSPWNIFYNEITALFEDDEEVNVVIDEKEYTVKLYVNNLDKASALSIIMPKQKEFGNITVKVSVIPPNVEELSKGEVFSKAFAGNKAFSHSNTQETGPLSPGMTYVVFTKKVVQYYSDNLRDESGYTSTLYQNIAEDVFEEDPSVAYCTSLKEA